MTPAGPVTVLIVFYSRGGATENLAHAAAVGAVQKRGLIRLRRVADADPAAALARFPESGDSLRRMLKEYVAPKEADVLAVDALILASPADVDASVPEWTSYLEMLGRLSAAGMLAGKVAAVIPHGAAASLVSALARLDIPVVPAGAGSGVDAAVALGRSVVAAVQAMRGTQPSA